MNLRLCGYFLKAAVKCLLLSEPRIRPEERLSRELTRQYIYAAATDETWATMHWRGHRILKSPTDLWMYAEIVQSLRPAVIIETGTYEGGSAIFLADLIKLFGLEGRVISIDIAARATPQSDKVLYVAGGSVDGKTLARISEFASLSPKLIILDSDHHFGHVASELDAYSKLLSKGDFLIVEDTMCDYADGGPAKAVAQFLAQHPEFQSQKQYERLGLSFNLGGYLRKIS